MLSNKGILRQMVLALILLALGQAMGILQPTEEEPLYTPETVVITGTVIRQEQVVSAPCLGDWYPVEHPQRVAAGGALYTEGNDRDEASLGVRLLAGAKKASLLSLPRRRGQLHEAIAAIAGGDDPEWMMELVLGEGEISEEELEAAQVQRTPEAHVIYAPQGGIFADGTDGLEALLTPESPELPDIIEKDPLGLGRIITEDSWYFYGEFPEQLSVGAELSVELLGGIFAQTVFVVERSAICPEGTWMTLCRCESGVEQVAEIRKLSVKILPE